MIVNIKLFFKKILSRIYRKIIGKNVFAIIVDSENGLFAIDPEDYGVGRHLRKGKFALDEIERIKQFITTKSNILSVGSHIGSLVVPLSKICNQVVAIEANPKTYNLLR